MAKNRKKKKKKLHTIKTPFIERDVALIQTHPHYVGESLVYEKPFNENWQPISFRVLVAQSIEPDSKTVHGVKGVEMVTIAFPRDYPFRSPELYLRTDFPRELPHINPYLGIGGLVSPCIVDGKVSDLIVQPDGILRVIDQWVEWLRHAAFGELIDTRQGWEPQRRDELSGQLICDAQKMRSLVSQKEGRKILSSNMMYDPQSLDKQSALVTRVLEYDGIPKIDDDTIITVHPDVVEARYGVLFAPTFTIVAWSNEGHVLDQYQPNYVENYRDFLELAELSGCRNQFTTPLGELAGRFYGAFGTENEFLIVVALAVRRPTKVIGSGGSAIELLPYVIRVAPQKLSVGKGYTVSETSPCWAIRHRHAISSELLSRISGTSHLKRNKEIHLIGCGSLGSKIGLHLARAGYGPFVLYDFETFSPHNAARHAVTDILSLPGQYKAEAVAHQIKRLGAEATPIKTNVVLQLGPLAKSPPFSEGSVVIDATASLQIHEALQESKNIISPIVQTALFGEGQLGCIAIESGDREVRVGDLRSMLFDACIEKDSIRNALFGERHGPMLGVGQGCGSMTIVAADDEISEFSAGMSRAIRMIIQAGPSDEGGLFVGTKDDIGCGITWSQIPVPRFASVPPDLADGWEIRISGNAAAEIERLARENLPNEFGGVLFGAISILHRRFTVTRVIPAPPDSTYTATKFELGVEGLKEEVLRLRQRSGETLSYLGTWHSHPKGGGPSAEDRSSAKKISELRLGAPAALLIWTPEIFYAAVEPKTE